MRRYFNPVLPATATMSGDIASRDISRRGNLFPPRTDRSGPDKLKGRIFHHVRVVAFGSGRFNRPFERTTPAPTRRHGRDLEAADAQEEEPAADRQHVVDPLTALGVPPRFGTARGTGGDRLRGKGAE
jgi:hypothetical protein